MTLFHYKLPLPNFSVVCVKLFVFFYKKAMEKHVYLTNISKLLTEICEMNMALDYKL